MWGCFASPFLEASSYFCKRERETVSSSASTSAGEVLGAQGEGTALGKLPKLSLWSRKGGGVRRGKVMGGREVGISLPTPGDSLNSAAAAAAVIISSQLDI